MSIIVPVCVFWNFIKSSEIITYALTDKGNAAARRQRNTMQALMPGKINQNKKENTHVNFPSITTDKNNQNAVKDESNR